MQELTQRGLQGPTQRAILFSQTSQTPSPPLSKQPTPPEAWSAEWVEQHPNPDFRKRFNSGAGGTGRVIDASPAGQEISQTPLSFPVGYRAGCSKVGGLPLPLAPSPSPPPYLPCRGLYQHGYGCHGLACRGVQHACCAIMDDDDDGYDGDVEEAHPTGLYPKAFQARERIQDTLPPVTLDWNALAYQGAMILDGVEVLQHAGGSEPAAAQALRQVLQFRHPAAAKDVQQAAETSSSACSFLSALLGHKMAGDAMVRAHKGRCRWCCIVTSCLDDNMLEEGIVRFSRCWFQVDKGSNTLEVWLEVCKAGKKLWQPDLAFPLHSPVQPVNHAQWKSPSYVGHMRAYVC
eukprot:scaffold174672_cov20-Tisochrysis_lutea.AAC.4